MLQNLKNKFLKFMYGRYGKDELNIFLLYFLIGIVIVNLMTIFMMFRIDLILNLLYLIIVAIFIFRFTSKNFEKRRNENRKFLKYKSKVVNFFTGKKDYYKYFKCPSCKQEVRIPRDKGKILITCPKCGNKFEKKS